MEKNIFIGCNLCDSESGEWVILGIQQEVRIHIE